MRFEKRGESVKSCRRVGERMDQGDSLGLSVSRGPLEHGCVFFKSHLVLEAQASTE